MKSCTFIPSFPFINCMSSATELTLNTHLTAQHAASPRPWTTHYGALSTNEDNILQ